MSGSRLGSYEILSAIGAGGMGESLRAAGVISDLSIVNPAS